MPITYRWEVSSGDHNPEKPDLTMNMKGGESDNPTHVARLGDRSSILPNLPREELVERPILFRIRLFQLFQALFQLETLDERPDMLHASRVVVLFPHLYALVFEQLDSPFPPQEFFLSRAVVQGVHTDPDVDGHGFKDL